MALYIATIGSAEPVPQLIGHAQQKDPNIFKPNYDIATIEERQAALRESIGTIAEVSEPDDRVYGDILFSAAELGRRTLVLASRLCPNTLPGELRSQENIWYVRYSQTYSAVSALKVYLHTTCRLETPLDPEIAKLEE